MLTAIGLALLLFPLMVLWMVLARPEFLSDLLWNAARSRPGGRKGVFRELAEQARIERNGGVAEQTQFDPIQAEIDRKCAIADEAIAARRRGETYVPPDDYDR
jgi:hypothetical protein